MPAGNCILPCAESKAEKLPVACVLPVPAPPGTFADLARRRKLFAIPCDSQTRLPGIFLCLDGLARFLPSRLNSNSPHRSSSPDGAGNDVQFDVALLEKSARRPPCPDPRLWSRLPEQFSHGCEHVLHVRIVPSALIPIKGIALPSARLLENVLPTLPLAEPV